MPVNHSPLRYPGGKAALAPFFKCLIRDNGLKDIAYAEPYCGGAGAALELLFSEVADRIYLNDIDPAIFSIWREIVQAPDKLCAAVADATLDMDEWYAQRDYYRTHRRRIGPKLAFATLFLNRTNRSGILGAGPIGGLSQAGNWKLDARFNKDALIQKIQRIARYAVRIHVSQMDAVVFLKSVANHLEGDAMVYLDPPYYVQGQNLYVNHYSPDDHRAIAKFVTTKLRIPWVVSYDRHPEIEKLYGLCNSVDYGINYTAQARYFGRELMVFCDDLSIDAAVDPLSVGRHQSQRFLRESDEARRALPLVRVRMSTA